MVEFVANNNISACTKLSLFCATKGLHLRMSFDIVELSNTSIQKRIFQQKTLDMSGNIQATGKFAQKTLAIAQESQAKQGNKHRRDILYTISDKVWLSTKNIITDPPSKKLDHKMFGLFEVIKNKMISVEL